MVYGSEVRSKVRAVFLNWQGFTRTPRARGAAPPLGRPRCKLSENKAKEMKVLLCALLLLAAAVTYGEYFAKRSIPKWENVGEDHSEFGGETVYEEEMPTTGSGAASGSGSGMKMKPFINVCFYK